MENVHPLSSRLSRPEPITWVFAGDSITQGSVHLLEFRNYVQLFEERIRTELKRPLDAVINTAIGGWTLAQILQQETHLISRFHPTVFSICIGMNDAAHVALGELDAWETSYSQLLQRLREAGTEHLVLHTLPPVDVASMRPMAQKRLNAPHFSAVIRRLAKTHGAVLIDHEQFWNKRAEANDRATLFSQSDTIHPNTYGHRMMFECLCRCLEIWDSKSPLGRLFQFY